jgi:hypothetical protein
MELLLDCLVSALFIAVYLSDARTAPIAPPTPTPIVTEKSIAPTEESILAGVTQYMAQAVAEFTTLSIDPDAWEAEPGHHPLVAAEWDLESECPSVGLTTAPIELLTADPIDDTTTTPIDSTTTTPIDGQPVTPLERMTLKQLAPIAKGLGLRTSNVRKPALLAAIKAAMAE